MARISYKSILKVLDYVSEEAHELQVPMERLLLDFGVNSLDSMTPEQYDKICTHYKIRESYRRGTQLDELYRLVWIKPHDLKDEIQAYLIELITCFDECAYQLSGEAAADEFNRIIEICEIYPEAFEALKYNDLAQHIRTLTKSIDTYIQERSGRKK